MFINKNPVRDFYDGNISEYPFQVAANIQKE